MFSASSPKDGTTLVICDLRRRRGEEDKETCHRGKMALSAVSPRCYAAQAAGARTRCALIGRAYRSITGKRVPYQTMIGFMTERNLTWAARGDAESRSGCLFFAAAMREPPRSRLLSAGSLAALGKLDRSRLRDPLFLFFAFSLSPR